MENDETDNQEPQNTSMFFTRLFRGDVSLLITYWVFGVLVGNIGFYIISKIIKSNILAVEKSIPWLPLTFFCIVIVYLVFVFIAIWRSAGKYKGRHLWRNLARVIVVISAIVLTYRAVKTFSQYGNPSMSNLQEGVNLINHNLPRMVDEHLRMDRVAIHGKRLLYYYTFVDATTEGIDAYKLKHGIERKIQMDLCNKRRSRSLLNRGIKYIYTYRDKSGIQIAQIEIQKSDCSVSSGANSP